MKRPCLLACSILLLTACNGKDDAPIIFPVDVNPGDSQDASDACHRITDGAGSVTGAADAGCTDCSVSDVARAADSDFDTGAKVTAGHHPGTCSVPVLVCDPPQGVTVRAIAQNGVVFPSGQYPGVFLHGPGGDWSIEVRTYLDGELQERTGMGSESSNEEHSTGSGLKAKKPFDAVEVFVANDREGGAATIDVSELCSDIPIFHDF